MLIAGNGSGIQRAAVPLVLDWSYCTPCHPVDAVCCHSRGIAILMKRVDQIVIIEAQSARIGILLRLSKGFSKAGPVNLIRFYCCSYFVSLLRK